mmetsp:Transcript_6949/g.24329  ORF Transcript_6949/g.24329 Transcript_6949/m.24329 type:complete len:216 (+) Transcript_6949:608-1255(+)
MPRQDRLHSVAGHAIHALPGDGKELRVVDGDSCLHVPEGASVLLCDTAAGVRLVIPETLSLVAGQEDSFPHPPAPGCRQHRCRHGGGAAVLAERMGDMERRATAGGHHVLLRRPHVHRLVHPATQRGGGGGRKDAGQREEAQALPEILHDCSWLHLSHSYFRCDDGYSPRMQVHVGMHCGRRVCNSLPVCLDRACLPSNSQQPISSDPFRDRDAK